MKKILFVDDEVKILQGIKRMLYPLRNEWEMYFADNGAEALQIMGKNSIDIIISDLRMPQMDGVQLWQRVSELYPETVRIVLSGYADKGMIMKVTSTAHQYLTKPCDSEIIKNTISRIINLREVIFDKEVRKIVSLAKSIPVLPEVYNQIQQKLKDPDVSIKDVGEIIAKDLVLSSKVLQLVNSSFFGLFRNVSNPIQATGLLGIETITSLVLSVKIFEKYAKHDNQEAIKEVMEHSMKVANLAKKIALKLSDDSAMIESSFIAGLLHDIGILIFETEFTAVYQKMKKKSLEEKSSISQTERKFFKTSHAEVGGYLLTLWGMPDPVVEAITFHHQPASSNTNTITPLTCVYLADSIFNDFAESNNDYLESMGLKDEIDKLKMLKEDFKVEV